jgi:hypothetical protein
MPLLPGSKLASGGFCAAWSLHSGETAAQTHVLTPSGSLPGQRAAPFAEPRVTAGRVTGWPGHGLAGYQDGLADGGARLDRGMCLRCLVKREHLADDWPAMGRRPLPGSPPDWAAYARQWAVPATATRQGP